MKGSLLVFATVVSALLAKAEVNDVEVRQNWPWSNEVEIAFSLTEKSDVSITATWDGLERPLDIGEDIAPSTSDLLPGRYVFKWTPPANTTLTNFRVNVEEIGFDARKYLVVNLRTGDCEFRATPDDNWNDNAYRTTKMVFARIPAGTYTLGLTQDQLNTVFPDGSKPVANSPVARQMTRTVKITHDYYLSSFLVSAGQITSATNNYDGKGVASIAVTYNDVRGSTSQGIDWPNTGHRVAVNSVIDGFRRKLTKLPKGWVLDLTTSAQWEVAARCGTTSLFTDESLSGNSTRAELESYIDANGWWNNSVIPTGYNNGTIPVGYKASNPWGVREMVGSRVQMTADWFQKVDSFKQWPTEVMVDPVGVDAANNRESRSVGMLSAKVIGDVLATRISYSAAGSQQYLRLCIYTHSLFGE